MRLFMLVALKYRKRKPEFYFRMEFYTEKKKNKNYSVFFFVGLLLLFVYLFVCFYKFCYEKRTGTFYNDTKHMTS